MNASEACEVFNTLPFPAQLQLRGAARDSLKDKGFSDIGTSDVSGECFSLIMSGEYHEILGFKQCSDCKEWFDDLPESGICEGCYEAGSICPACNGSGEGMHDGSTCRRCGGSGDEYHPRGRSRREPDYEPDHDDRTSEEMDRDAERASRIYESQIMGR
jgi:hypothetical protein